MYSSHTTHVQALIFFPWATLTASSSSLLSSSELFFTLLPKLTSKTEILSNKVPPNLLAKTPNKTLRDQGFCSFGSHGLSLLPEHGLQTDGQPLETTHSPLSDCSNPKKGSPFKGGEIFSGGPYSFVSSVICQITSQIR